MTHPRDLIPSDDPDRDRLAVPLSDVTQVEERPHRGGRRAVTAAVAVMAIAATVWALNPAGHQDQTPRAASATTAPVPSMTSTVSASSPSQTSTSTTSATTQTGPLPAEAVAVGRRFVAAWTLPASPARRAAALTPVATPRLVNTLAPLTRGALPKIGGPVTTRTTSPIRVVLTVPVTGTGTAVLVALSDGHRWRIAAVGLERL